MAGEINVDIKIEEINPVKKKLLFDIPWSDVKKELDSQYRDVGKSARIKGFRQGKTPRNVLEMHYKGHVEEQTVSNLMGASYEKVLKENNILPVAEPVIDQGKIEKNKNFTFSTTVEIKPVIEPKDYLGLELEKDEVTVTDEDVRARLEGLRNVHSTLENLESDRGVIEGDFVYVDFEGKHEDKPIKELTQENYLLEIGSRRFLPGFEEQLTGMKTGESKEIAIKIPDKYYLKEIEGKEISFSVTVKDIKKKVLPELDDDFIKNFEKYESLNDLKQDIRRSLEKEKGIDVDTNLNKRIVDILLEKNEFDIPSAFIERQIFSMMLDAQRRMVTGGTDPESAAEASLNLRDRFKEEAEKIVKFSLLFDSIAGKESITVGEEEIEEKVRELAVRQGRDYESFRRSCEDGNMIEQIKAEMLKEKTLDFIKEKAKITLVKKAIDENPEEK